MGMWSSRHGKFLKKDPNHGAWGRKIKGWWRKFRHWCCKKGLCNFDKCKCKCHCKGRSAAYYSCKDEIVESKKDKVTLPVKSHWTDDPPPYINPEE